MAGGVDEAPPEAAFGVSRVAGKGEDGRPTSSAWPPREPSRACTGGRPPGTDDDSATALGPTWAGDPSADRRPCCRRRRRPLPGSEEGGGESSLESSNGVTETEIGYVSVRTPSSEPANGGSTISNSISAGMLPWHERQAFNLTTSRLCDAGMKPINPAPFVKKKLGCRQLPSMCRDTPNLHLDGRGQVGSC